MTLEEIISLKLKSLYVEIERLRNNSLKLDEETEKLTMVLLESEEFIHTMSEDWANIGKLSFFLSNNLINVSVLQPTSKDNKSKSTFFL